MIAGKWIVTCIRGNGLESNEKLSYCFKLGMVKIVTKLELYFVASLAYCIAYSFFYI